MVEMLVAIAGIALKAVTAILVAFLGLKHKLPRWQKWAVGGIVFCLLAGAATDAVQERERQQSERAEFEIRKSIRGSLSQLEQNAQHTEAEKRLAIQRNQQIRAALVPLVREGIGVRDRCSAPRGQAEYVKWTKKAEHTLARVDPADVTAFENAEGPFICYEQMSVELDALEAVLQRH